VARAEDGAAIGVLLYERHCPRRWKSTSWPWSRGDTDVVRGGHWYDALEDAPRADGTRMLSVETLGPSRPDENYERTRSFYEACGFVPVEESSIPGKTTLAC